jgi:hypothetical protein
MIKDLRKSNSPKTAKYLRDLCLEENTCIISDIEERKERKTGLVSALGQSLGCPIMCSLGRFGADRLVKVGSHQR